MRTGKDLILATRPFAADNPARSWFYVLSTWLLLILSFAGTLWNVHPVGKLICSLLTGLFILRSFVIYHDHQHHSILAHSRVADFLMRIYGTLTLSPSSVWKSSHDYHHKHNSKLRSAHIGSFPIMTKTKFETCTPRQRMHYLFIRHPVTILFGYVFAFLYGMCLKPFLSDPRRHLDGLVALLAHAGLAFCITWFFGWAALGRAILFPYLFSYAFGTYLFYAQHNFPGVTFNDHAGWTYEKAAMESSSFMRTGPVMAWFTANIGYHHIHHLNAKIPFYRLPEAYAAVPELRNAKQTSLSLRDITRCLRLRAWDVEAQRMV